MRLLMSFTLFFTMMVSYAQKNWDESLTRNKWAIEHASMVNNWLSEEKRINDKRSKFALQQNRQNRYSKVIEKLRKSENYVPSIAEQLFDKSLIGGTYNYSKDFPIGLSLFGSYGMFMGSLDIGLDFSSKEHKETDFVDEKNYTERTWKDNTSMFITFTPSFFYKYFAIGCGVGVMSHGAKDIKETKHWYSETPGSGSTTTVDEHGNISTTTDLGTVNSGSSTSTSNLDESWDLMIRPNLKGFIPITKSTRYRDNQWFITISAGYDYCFKYKEKNGFNVGIGVAASIDL